MIKEALEYLSSLQTPKNPVTVTVGEQPYAVRDDGTLGAAVRDLAPQWVNPTFEVASLSALAQLFTQKVDALPDVGVAFHVKDHLTVEIVSLLADKYAHRHVYARAKHAIETPFVFDRYYPSPEDFLIAFRASFLFNEEAVKVQQLCSTVGAGEAVIVADDGVSQEVTVKSGTVTKSSISLPADGVQLIPWRTFREASPVVSKFLLRMKGVKDGLPQIALFEIDGKWKLETRESVASWIRAAAPTATVIA